jgi:hypothetical protein
MIGFHFSGGAACSPSPSNVVPNRGVYLTEMTGLANYTQIVVSRGRTGALCHSVKSHGRRATLPHWDIYCQFAAPRVPQALQMAVTGLKYGGTTTYQVIPCGCRNLKF